MNKTDAKDYRQAAELIASGKQKFSCHALSFQNEEWSPGVDRLDLVEPFQNMFCPKEGCVKDYYVFWNERAKKNCPTKTKNHKHSRECRIFALLLMAEMIESP
jgi:hypothetical protein